jgi:hypothetical protein
MKICNICNIEKELSEYYKGRHYCKQCYLNKRKCEHNQQHDYCKQCNGTQICVHDKFKKICKECNGSGICEHNKQKYNCKECNGSGICEHNINKYNCKECKGNGICEHNKNKRYCKECKECNGSQICEHNKNKRYCKECNGSGICEHNKQKYNCKECNGNGICEHNKQKYNCKECNGNGICIHDKAKYNCYICQPNSNYFCKIPLCDKSATIKKFKGYCCRCFFFTFHNEPITRNYKNKENSVADFIKKEFKEYDITLDRRIQDGCTKRRPDILLDFGEKVIIIEVDENQHTDYDSTCEKNRLNNLLEDIDYRNLILIRFNPDSYKSNDNKINSCWSLDRLTGKLKINNKKNWNNRLNKLKEELIIQINNNTEELFTVIHLFYDY